MTKASQINQLLFASKADVWGWFLFDQKTAPQYMSLIFKLFLIDFKKSDDFILCHLFPFWKQLNEL